jgi:hypothetical protein
MLRLPLRLSLRGDLGDRGTGSNPVSPTSSPQDRGRFQETEPASCHELKSGRRYYGDCQSTMWVRRIAGAPGSVQRLGAAEALRLPLQAPTPRPEGRLDALL